MSDIPTGHAVVVQGPQTRAAMTSPKALKDWLILIASQNRSFSREKTQPFVPCEHLCPKNHAGVFLGSSTVVSWEDVLIGMSSEIAVDILKTKPSEKIMNVHSNFSSFSTLHLGIGTAHLSTSPMPQHQHMLQCCELPLLDIETWICTLSLTKIHHLMCRRDCANSIQFNQIMISINIHRPSNCIDGRFSSGASFCRSPDTPDLANRSEPAKSTC